MYIKVEDDKDLVRDSQTNAILNTNLSELAEHRKKRDLLLQKQNKIIELESRLENLENAIKKILDKDTV